MDIGVGLVTFQDGQQVDLVALKEAAKLSGFELFWTDLVATGLLIRATGPDKEEDLAIRVASTGQMFSLGPGDSDETRRNYTEVARWADDGTTRLRIRGRAHAHPGAPPGMTISLPSSSTMTF